MSLFQNPVRATTVRGEDQVLVVGVIANTQSIPPSVRLLINYRNGELSLADVGDVVMNWRYGTIPHGKRAGQVGWFDFVPDGEEPMPEVDVDYLDDDDH